MAARCFPSSADPPRPKNGRNHIISNVEITGVGVEIGGVWAAGAHNSAGVYEKCLAMRRNDEDRIALTNIDCRNLENAIAMHDGMRPYGHRACSKQNHHGGRNRVVAQAKQNQSGCRQADGGGSPPPDR